MLSGFKTDLPPAAQLHAAILNQRRQHVKHDYITARQNKRQPAGTAVAAVLVRRKSAQGITLRRLSFRDKKLKDPPFHD